MLEMSFLTRNGRQKYKEIRNAKCRMLNYFSIASQLCLFSGISVIRKALKEIIVQNVADFQQQIGVNPFAVEDFVGILS